ncbi:MAG: M23 family metallopeptidase [Clostridiales bacterium]|jgi:murein DD-endopeptidase MepM/ murein hydrolase activator NlpD|nr:M23 family metallopeptidase [Clostridiales bacterium]
MDTKKILGKTASFFKKNYYYVIMAVCVMAIGAMITVAVVNANKPTQLIPDGPGTEVGVDPEEPGDPTGTTPTLFVQPVNAAAGTGMIYDDRELQYSASQDQWQAHFGVDYLVDAGTDVFAVSAGVVESVESNEMWGTTIVIRHDNDVKSIYRCLGSDVTVLKNQRVTTGQKIGSVAANGYLEAAEGIHLHFEMTANGVPVDPAAYLDENK